MESVHRCHTTTTASTASSDRGANSGGDYAPANPNTTSSSAIVASMESVQRPQTTTASTASSDRGANSGRDDAPGSSDTTSSSAVVTLMESVQRRQTTTAASTAGSDRGAISGGDDAPGNSNTTSSSAVVSQILQLIQSDDPDSKIRATREIRRLTKTSQRYRRQFSNAVKPLVDMLRSSSVESNLAALLALLNLAVKDEANKVSIINTGALESIISFLESKNVIFQDHATAALLTLSASSVTRPIVSTSGVIPLLGEVLRHGSHQAKVDAAMTLYNLSTYQGNLYPILDINPIPSIVSLLSSCKKSSKTAEKCTTLIESLVGYELGRTALTSEEGGVLSVVEVLESGSHKSRKHAVGALLTLCQSDRCKYREPILREGAIPGLMQLTVQGTPKSQAKAKTLLMLLRDSPFARSELHADTLENIVSNLMMEIDVKEKPGKAKEMLAEMVQISMEQSQKHLQQTALVCTPAALSVASCASKISSK